jgi:hypothetical protein
VGLITLPCKKKIVEKPPRNSVGFYGGGQGVSWVVEPRKEEEGQFQDGFFNTTNKRKLALQHKHKGQIHRKIIQKAYVKL